MAAAESRAGVQVSAPVFWEGGGLRSGSHPTGEQVEKPEGGGNGPRRFGERAEHDGSGGEKSSKRETELGDTLVEGSDLPSKRWAVEAPTGVRGVFPRQRWIEEAGTREYHEGLPNPASTQDKWRTSEAGQEDLRRRNTPAHGGGPCAWREPSSVGRGLDWPHR